MNSKITGAVSANDIAAGLKSLLLARADGSITQDEFEHRQALLHAQILSNDSGAAPKSTSGRKPGLLPTNLVLIAVAVLVACIALAVGYMISEKSQRASASEDIAALSTALSTLPGAGNASSPDKSSMQSPLTKNAGGDLSEAAKHLAAKLSKDPSNGDGWLLLARSYGQLRQPKEAAEAYTQAAAHLPADAAMLADWADALVMSRGAKWDSESAAIVARALAADPKNLKALALAGSEAFAHANYPVAITFWKRMKTVAPPDSMDAKLADSNISEAESLLTGKQSKPK